MKKVKLSLDMLRVDSFRTAEIAQKTGTVQAQEWTPHFSCFDSCNESCTCPIGSVCWSCFDC